MTARSAARCTACFEEGHDRRRCTTITAAIYDLDDVIAALEREPRGAGWQGRTLRRVRRNLVQARDRAIATDPRNTTP